jgi:Xaa-Pro aminopeptidase
MVVFSRLSDIIVLTIQPRKGEEEMKRNRWLLAIALLAVATPAFAQSALYYQSHIPPEEFRARWQKVFEKIGDRAVARVQGAPLASGFVFPRQSNEFYYLCGVETPHSYLLLDGAAGKRR